MGHTDVEIETMAPRAALLLGLLLIDGRCDHLPLERAPGTTAPVSNAPVSNAPVSSTPTVTADRSDAEVPLLAEGARLYPESQVRLSPSDPRDAARLADVDTCGGCHPDVLRTWRASAHSRSSFDSPWYRQAVDAIREERGTHASRFCAGGHDPVLLVAGAVDAAVRSEDPRAHAGVTCAVCHGIQEARFDGSGSYTLSNRPIPLPDPADPEEVAVHVEAVAPDPLRTVELCASCHPGFLGPDMGNPYHFQGFDDVTPWLRSTHAGSAASRVDEPQETRNCADWHMPSGPATQGDMAADPAGDVRLHRVAEAHTALAGATGDEEQLRAIQARLRSAARIDVAAVRSQDRSRRWLPADGASVRPGESVEIDVVVRNLGTGHAFPGGTLDAQDTWMEVEVRDADGALVAEAGTRHARSHDDPTAHRLRALVVDDRGEPVFRHRVQHFRATVADRTIAPRDAAVVRYALRVPEEVQAPLAVHARLRHRRHDGPLHAAACAFNPRRGDGPSEPCPSDSDDLRSTPVVINPSPSSRTPFGSAKEPTRESIGRRDRSQVAAAVRPRVGVDRKRARAPR